MPLPTLPTEQFAMFIVIQVKDDRVDELRKTLATIRTQTKNQMLGKPDEYVLFPFEKMSTIHYARFVLLEPCPRFGTGYQLGFSTNYDGPVGEETTEPVARRRHLDEIVRVARQSVEEIFGTCKNYPSGASDKLVVDFLDRDAVQVPAQTFYVGGAGRSRDQVFEEAKLRTQIDEVLDQNYTQWKDKSAEEIRQEVLNKVGAPAKFPPQPDLAYKADRLKNITLLVFILTFPISIPLLIMGAITLRMKEKNDPQFEPVYSKAERDHQEDASLDEDIFLQNQLTHLVDVKPGWFRGMLLRVVFKALAFLAKNVYNKGTLGGIPSIHFARWVFVDRGKRLLFLSNFDSSWQSYLGDFIDQASSGLTGVWSNTVGYPQTEWLLSSGSRSASRFKAWTRHYQIPTLVWYSAYPGLSIQNINDNTKIRRGLADPNAMSAKWWLLMLGCGPDGPEKVEPVPADQKYPKIALPFSQIQGLILRGYGHKKAARFLMLKVTDASAARKWLGGLSLTHAEQAPRKQNMPDPFINLAFTHRGLHAFELDNDILDAFPIEFVEGCDRDNRSRILGDVGINDPKNWNWGSGEKSVDVLLMVYASSEAALKPYYEKFKTEAGASGLRLLADLEGGELPGRKEHFGFRDGISQPVVQGTGREERDFNTIAPGEMLLGYDNAYRSIESEGDNNITHSPKNENIDFGQNGSYLVFRQLEQDVNTFWQNTSMYAEQGLASSAVEAASKMVGRWPNGGALIRHPNQSPETPSAEDYSKFDVKEDRFSYLSPGKQNDYSGSRCPFGSHIRRSNPRDWELGNTRLESMRLSNLHRIIRRGRPYGEAYVDDMATEKMIAKAKAGGDSKKRGLQFICFNANIERQFEFAQQQWSNNSKFGKLVTDADPISGSIPPKQVGLGEPTFTIQNETLRSRCPNMKQFVTVKGSAYMFMPSLSAVKYLMKS